MVYLFTCKRMYMYTCVGLQIQLYSELLTNMYDIVIAPFIKIEIDTLFADLDVMNWHRLSPSIIDLSLMNNISNGNAIFLADLVTTMDCVQSGIQLHFKCNNICTFTHITKYYVNHPFFLMNVQFHNLFISILCSHVNFLKILTYRLRIYAVCDNFFLILMS